MSVTLRRDPAERRRRPAVLAAHACCCCCCLHVIGGLIGAGLASRVRWVRSAGGKKFDLETEKRARNERRGVTVYWLTLIVLTLLSVLQSFVFGERGFGFAIVLMGLPLVQLGASLVSLIVVFFKYPEEDRGAIYRRIGRITAISTLWAFISGALMIGLFKVLN